jgi:transcription initiation factor TFIID subunit TAF12
VGTYAKPQQQQPQQQQPQQQQQQQQQQHSEDGGADWEAGDPPPVSSGAVWAITNGTAAKGMEKRAGRAKKVRRGWRGMDRCRGRSAAEKPKSLWCMAAGATTAEGRTA